MLCSNTADSQMEKLFHIQREEQQYFPAQYIQDQSDYMIHLVVTGTIKLPRIMFPIVYKPPKVVAEETGCNESSALVVSRLSYINPEDIEDELFETAIPGTAGPGDASSCVVTGRLPW